MGIMRAGGPIMWVIFVLSIIALGVFIERVLFFDGLQLIQKSLNWRLARPFMKMTQRKQLK